jgi:hypothetical protein
MTDFLKKLTDKMNTAPQPGREAPYIVMSFLVSALFDLYFL